MLLPVVGPGNAYWQRSGWQRPIDPVATRIPMFALQCGFPGRGRSVVANEWQRPFLRTGLACRILDKSMYDHELEVRKAP
jgi:hypothetical protein